MKNVLAIGAHPDDIEFGVGGTLVKHRAKGDGVVYLCMTGTESKDGTTGEVLRTEEQLQSEIRCAADILGVHFIEILSYTDLKIPFTFESVSAIEAVIKKYKIDIIYTHWEGDANQDHINTFKATMAAARYVPNVYCYEQIPVPRLTANPMTINHYVDITTSFKKKIEASNCHESQMTKYNRHGFSVEDNLETLAKFRGIQAKCKYAEAFQVVKQVR
jgi:N-acetylglucosamine malate deacetylase 1